MRLSPLTISCPGCGSNNVVYTCDPSCCFNHVCSDCLKSFELSTEDLEQSADGISIEAQAKDSCAPTVACARCKGLSVYRQAEEGGSPGKLVCASCKALLELSFSFE